MQGFFNKLSKREKYVLYVSATFVFLALLDRAILDPIIARMKMFEDEIKTTEYELIKNSKILQQRNRIESEEKKYASYFLSANSDEEETAFLLLEIENLASLSSVYLIDLKPSGVETEGMIKRFKVNLSCEAEMEQLISFMYSIENSDMLLQVGAFTLNPKSKKSSVDRCNLLLYKIAVP